MKTELRTPPYSEDVERAFIGALFLDPPLLEKYSNAVRPTDLYLEAHRAIYRAMIRTWGKYEDLDRINVIEALKVAGKLEAAGGEIAVLNINAPSAVNVEAHAQTIVEYSAKRTLIGQLERTTAAAYEGAVEMDNLISTVTDTLRQITTRSSKESTKTLADRTIAAEKLAEGDWLDGPPPPPRKALLTLPGEEQRLFLPQGKTAMLAAPGGVGKTTILIGLALSVATNKPWLNHYPVDGPGRVLLALGEEDAEEVRRALFWQARNLGLTSEGYRKLIYERIVALPLAGTRAAFIEPNAGLSPTGTLLAGHEHDDWTPEFVSLRRYLADNGPWSLIILDPASRFMGPDAETDNAAATRFIEMLELLAQSPGSPTVLIAHHTNKASFKAGRASQGDARGSSALTDGIRWQASLKPVMLADGIPNNGNRIVLEVTKTNYGPQPWPLHMVRPEGDHTWRPMTKKELEDEEHAVEQANLEAKAKAKRDRNKVNELAKKEENNAFAEAEAYL